MKKAQTLLEYFIFLMLIMLVLVLWSRYFDRGIILFGGEFGLMDGNGKLIVRPYTK